MAFVLVALFSTLPFAPRANSPAGPVAPEPPPGRVEHFKCYDVARFPPQERVVTLADQFEKVNAFVDRADKLCNPVSKNGEPIHDKETHLACYKIWGWSLPRVVLVSNQFGKNQTLVVTSPATLCVPSAKEVPPPRFDHFKCYKAN